MRTNLNYEQLVKTIANHIRVAPDTNGTVVFLNGPWGSGKTYFWKHEIYPQLESRKCIYVSLFGVMNVADLKQKLLSSILAGNEADSLLDWGRGVLTKISQTVFNFVESRAGFKFDIDLFELLSSKIAFTICFDDFERLPRDCSVEEILGFINYLSEHKGFKSLIIMDETQLKSEHSEAFYKLREKLSLRTFKLEIDMLSRHKMFLDSSSTANKTKLSSNEENEILHLLAKINTKNLRTIRFILECFFQLRINIKRELPADLIKFLIAMVDFESKDSTKEVKFYQINPAEIAMREYSRREKQNKHQASQVETESDPQTLFYHLYYGENAPYTMFKCVYDVVRNGHFSAEAAIAELFPTEAELTPHQLLATKIKNIHFYYCQDSELEALSSEILSLLKNSTTIDYSSLYSMAKGLSSTAKLLEKDPIISLPENFENLAVTAVKKIEDPSEIPRDNYDRINELEKIFVESLDKICDEERKRRLIADLDNAVKLDKIRYLKENLIENKLVLEQVFTGGQLESIWSEAMTNPENYVLIETINKALARSSVDNSKIKSELESTHKFLMTQYQNSKSKMHRLRIFRLIEATGLATPTDKPKVVKP